MKKSKKLWSLISLTIISLLAFVNDVYAACPLGPHVTKDLTNVLKIFKIAAPLLVIVVSTYEAVLALTKGDAQVELKKVFIRFCKRVGLAVLIFFLPVLVDQLMQMMNVWDDDGGCTFDSNPVIPEPEVDDPEAPTLTAPEYETLDPTRDFTFSYYGSKTCFTINDWDDIITNLHADPEPTYSTYRANPVCYNKDNKKIDCDDDEIIGGRIEFTATDDRTNKSLSYSFDIKADCTGSATKETGAQAEDLEFVMMNTSKTCFIDNSKERDSVSNNLHLIYKDKDNKKIDLGNVYTIAENGGTIEDACYQMDGRYDFWCNEPGWVEYTATYRGATVKQVVYFYKDLSGCGQGESAGKTATNITTAKKPEKLTLTYWGDKTCFTNDDLYDITDKVTANQQARVEPFCYNSEGKSVSCSKDLTGGYVEIYASTDTGLEDRMRFDVSADCSNAEVRIPPKSEPLSFKIESPNGCFSTKDRTYIKNNLTLYSGNLALGNYNTASIMGASVELKCYTTKGKKDWNCNNADGYMIFSAKYQNQTLDYRVDISSSCK